MLTNFIIENAYGSLSLNFRAALRISLVPLSIALAAALFINARLIFLLSQPTGYQKVTGVHAALVFLGLAFLSYAAFHVAVRWHRFSLDATNSVGPGRTLKYMLVSGVIAFGALVAMLIVLSVPGLVLGVGVAVNVGAFGEAFRSGIAAVVMNFVGTMGFAYVFMRFSPWLVATAIARPSAANFNRTKPLSGPILHTALIYAAATFLWSLFGLAGIPWPLAVVVDLALSWFAFMMSIAVLTEIYRATDPGHAT